MNKPITMICCGIATFGLLVLGFCIFYTVIYGHGDMEAGNFHRCRYWMEHNATTGRLERNWESSAGSTTPDEFQLEQAVDTWTVGLGLIVLGAAIYVAERYGRHERYPHP
ncbi:MAG: hypothetical protein WCO56_13940 [Verrucomicrobiota bacterium]